MLIVGEVDDLIVNERPNSHYVKVDTERTPDLIKCLAALRLGEQKPDGVAEDIWRRAARDMGVADNRQEGVHWRLVKDDEGKDKVRRAERPASSPSIALNLPAAPAAASCRASLATRCAA